jgi:hypoxia up-regulated 1
MIGIDLGSEFFKVCITLPHQNKFYMVENLQSKIKTNTAIYLKNTDRIYESEVLNKKLKNPKNSFLYLSKYLGEKNSENVDKYFKKYFYNYDYIFDNETNAINFKVKFVNEEENIVETKYPLEALYGMLFRYIEKISEKYYTDNFNKNNENKIYRDKNKIEYCSVTVPSYYTYKQRLSIIHAISLTNMHLLGILNDNTAAAFYFFKRNFDINNYKKPEENKEINFVYINIGSSNTQITLVSYNKEDMKVIGEVSDSDLGGHVFTRNLVIKIAQIIGIDEKNLDINLYNKLYQYAYKFKETLSANKEVHMNFALDNKNYKGLLTRDDFNEINKNDFNKIPKLFDELFLKTNKTLKDISQFELIGGSIRIPEIQNVIRDYIGEENSDLIGTHLNGDDSVAIGAAYGIRWRKKIFEGLQYNISIEILDEKNESNIVMNMTNIFGKETQYDTKEKINIVNNKNLIVDIYENNVKLMRCNFSTISNETKTFIKNMNKFKNSTYGKIPRIEFEFYISRLGIISLNAELIFNVRSYVGLNITNDTGTIYNSLDYVAPYSKEEIKEIKDKLNETLNPNITYLEKDLLNKKLRKGTFFDENVPIKIDFDIIDQAPKSFTEKDIKYWKKKLDFYEKREREEIKIIELRNELETLIYEKQNFLESSSVKELATDTEYSTLEKIITDTKNWFEDEGSYTRNITRLDSEIKLVNEEFGKVNTRINIKKERDLAIEKFLILIKNNQKKYLKEYKENKPWTEFFYDDEYVPKVKKLNDTLNEKIDQQNKLKSYEEPVLHKEEIDEMTKEVEELFNKMINIPVPVHPPRRENIKLEDLFNLF